MKRKIIAILLVFIGVYSFGQTPMKDMKMKTDTTSQPKKKKENKPTHDMKGMQMDDMDMGGMDIGDGKMDMKNMTSPYSLNLPMSRSGSGTSWSPDETPMYMLMAQKGKTNLMLHGNIFARYNSQDVFNKGHEGGSKFDAPNWFMGMLTHKLSDKDLLSAHLMMSFDPFLVGGNGYPLLYQSGESYEGKPLVNRQHPHDLFSELGVAYSHAFSKNVDAFVYFGYPGEPSIGPTAFMHRTSTMNNPDAPLGHHWQDATHIEFGVATVGFRWKKLMAEFSSFTGAEPDEHRYDFDKMTFNSYSYRLSFAPSANWSLQASRAHIKSPELLEPGVDVNRTTASAMYAKQWPKLQKHFTASLVWGMNEYKAEPTQHSVLLEANLQEKKHAFYGRYEFVQKSDAELGLNSVGRVMTVYNVNAFTFGYNHSLISTKHIELYAGAQATLNFSPKGLQNLYGKNPMAAEVYLQIRPRWM